jgi:hypothetical protein
MIEISMAIMQPKSLSFPNNLIYTGVGSRETPPLILVLMHMVAQRLTEYHWVLRSGHAEGADRSFEKGCDNHQGRKEIFLPWGNFCGSDSGLWNQPKAAFAVAEYIHPAWNKCSQGAKKLHARNVQQVLGYDLNRPTDLVICWTKDGVTQGGTATAIHIAEQLNIPIINLGYSYFDKFTVDNLLGVIEKQIDGAKYVPINQTKIGQILQDHGVSI